MTETTLKLKVCPEDSASGCEKVLQGEYDIEGLDLVNPIVLDVGANIGSFSLWAAHRWPGAIIFAYEPNPDTFKMLVENTEGLDIHRSRCAVWLADGKMPLYLGKNNIGECSLFQSFETQPGVAGVCRVVHARNLPECDVLKLDTEGAERAILENYPHLDSCKAVMLEWHSQEDRKFIRELLVSRGFVCVSDQEHWHMRGVQKFVRPKRPHLYVSILNGGGRSWSDNDRSAEGLKKLAPLRGIDLTMITDLGTGVDRSRNRQVAQAMSDPTMTHFMFIDNDIIFDPNWVCNMVLTGYQCVAGAYPRKDIDWEQVSNAVKMGVKPDDLAGHSSSWIINGLVKDELGGFAGRQNDFGDFVEVEEIGTGFLMVRREVFEAMLVAYGVDMEYLTDYEPRDTIQHTMFACQRDPACPRERAKAALLAEATCKAPDATRLYHAACKYGVATRNRASLGRYLTEDYAFCRYWRMLGGKIYLYIDASIEHLGTHCFRGKIKNYLKPAVEQEQGTEPVVTSTTGS